MKLSYIAALIAMTISFSTYADNQNQVPAELLKGKMPAQNLQKDHDLLFTQQSVQEKAQNQSDIKHLLASKQDKNFKFYKGPTLQDRVSKQKHGEASVTEQQEKLSEDQRYHQLLAEKKQEQDSSSNNLGDIKHVRD